MNRIIIIGNGFDLAHNLKTGYQDFINDYWAVVEEQVYGRYWQWLDQHYGGSKHIPENYKDNFVCIEKECGKTETNKVCFSYNENSPFRKLCTLINEYNSAPNAPVTVHLKFKNLFLNTGILHEGTLPGKTDDPEVRYPLCCGKRSLF